MTINGEKIEINEQSLANLKSQLDESLTSNPKFMDVLLKELKYVRYKTNSEEFSIHIAPDKKGITIISSNPVVDCAVHELRGLNRAFIHIMIRLHGEDMYDEYSQGVLFDREDVEHNGMRSSVHYETKLETSYFVSCYTKEGVEYSNSSFQDNYPLHKNSREIDLREQTLSSFHKPVFYETTLPKCPIHVLKGKARNTYRRKDNISIIHTNLANLTSNGYQDVMCSLHAVHPMFPDMLRGSNIIAKSVEKDGRYIFVADENYAKTIEEGYRKAKNETKESLEKQKESIAKITYDFMIENV